MNKCKHFARIITKKPYITMFFVTLAARLALEAVAEENPNTAAGRTAKRLIKIGNFMAWTVLAIIAAPFVFILFALA